MRNAKATYTIGERNVKTTFREWSSLFASATNREEQILGLHWANFTA